MSQDEEVVPAELAGTTDPDITVGRSSSRVAVAADAVKTDMLHPDGAPVANGPSSGAAGRSPVQQALHRLRRNYPALIFAGVFLVVVLMALVAPLYAHHIAHVGPNDNNVSGTITKNGKPVNVVSLIGVPIGPQWRGHYFLGADKLGRDVAVRLLYGARASLEIGVLATIITMVGATVLGLVSGFFGGWIDTIISRLLDLIWAYPALLLGVALGVSFAVSGISLGPLHIQGSSLLIPSFVIGVVYIPYVARPVRGEVLTLREREFVDAARTLGFSRTRIIFVEILPNLFSTLIVFFALQLAQSIVLEAALSFLGVGVQPPNPSWGTMLADGLDQITDSPHLTLAPGIMLVIAVLSINIFGDGLRQAFDPRARIRVER